MEKSKQCLSMPRKRLESLEHNQLLYMDNNEEAFLAKTTKYSNQNILILELHKIQSLASLQLLLCN